MAGYEPLISLLRLEATQLYEEGRDIDRAAANARREFGISKLEDRIIRSHMWPLTFFAFPRSREGWILTYIDKKVSWRETLKQRSRKYAAPGK